MASNAFQGLFSPDRKNRMGVVVSPTPKSKAQKPVAAIPQSQRKSATALASSAMFKKQYSELKLNRSIGIFADTLTIDVPDSFDGREVWKKYFAPVRNQGKCGACWAFASTTVLQMRLAIATNGKYNYELSPAKMVMCNMGGDHEYELAKESIDKGEPYDYNLPSQIAAGFKNKEKDSVSAVGCGGETLIGAWQFLYRFGVPEEKCMTYEDTADDKIDLFNYITGQDLPSCSDIISDTYDQCPATHEPMELHLAEGFYKVPGTAVKEEDPSEQSMQSGNEYNIRRDIIHWGPATSGFSVHEDFMAWDGKGVYQWDGKSPVSGGHAIVIVGWGTEEGVPYWLIRNSWGPEWGDKGYFKMLRGSNHCEIEENVIVGIPCIYGMRLFLKWPLLYRTEDLTLRSLWGVKPSGYKTTTFEEMAMGLIKPDLKLIKYQYDPSSWPDVSTFIAAYPETHIYRISDYYSPIKHPYSFLKLGSKSEYIIGGVVGAVVALAGVGIFFLVKNRKKHE